MTTRGNDNLRTLTEKEKQTLRLMVRGHDAKSIARSLGLSVHTINERLREARRKMAVSSSREAARLLLEAEGDGPFLPTPNFCGDTTIGDDAEHPLHDQDTTPSKGAWRLHRRSSIILGVCIVTLVLGLLALATLPQGASSPPPTSTEAATAQDVQVIETARRWLLLLDQSRWDVSYRETGAAFRKLNTEQVWAAASEQTRAPLGAVVSRTFLSQENLPAPPAGYEVVKFRTSFANKPDAVETVTLDRANGEWRVVGVTIG